MDLANAREDSGRSVFAVVTACVLRARPSAFCCTASSSAPTICTTYSQFKFSRTSRFSYNFTRKGCAAADLPIPDVLQLSNPAELRKIVNQEHTPPCVARFKPPANLSASEIWWDREQRIAHLDL